LRLSYKNQTRAAVYATLTLGALAAVAYTPAPTESSQDRVQRIYNKIAPQAGLGGLIPPISVDPGKIVNAYNTGTAIVIYQGIIDKCETDDQLALIIGHEIAHTTLFHFKLPYGENVDDTSAMEAQADKMGAFYVMKAGYDVCNARLFWKNMQLVYGDYIGGDHPTYSYRYSELNIQCESF